MEQRTLSAAYKFYCGKDLIDAHTASADTNATYEILKAQLDRYDSLENNIKKTQRVYLSQTNSRLCWVYWL